MDEKAKQRQLHINTTRRFKRSLMCGYYAVNHILKALGLPMVSEDDMDQIALKMADREASILYSKDPREVLDLAAHPQGNYAADTLIQVLHERSGMSVERWRKEQPLSSCAILVGSGNHWQAVLRDKEKRWFVLEQATRHPLQDVARFLHSRLANGAVYEVGMVEALPNSAFLENFSQRPSVLNQRPTTDSSKASPVRKRPCLFHPNGPVEFQVRVAPKPKPPPLCNMQPGLPEVILPQEFRDDPRFTFEGPQGVPLAQSPFHLVDLMTPSDQKMSEGEDENEPEKPQRPQRSRAQTHYYQSEAEEIREKDSRQRMQAASK